MNIVILFGLMLILILMGVPIGITIGVSTAISMFFTSSMPLMFIAQKAYTGLDLSLIHIFQGRPFCNSETR